jgi:hypothetical protein
MEWTVLVQGVVMYSMETLYMWAVNRIMRKGNRSVSRLWLDRIVALVAVITASNQLKALLSVHFPDTIFRRAGITKIPKSAIYTTDHGRHTTMCTRLQTHIQRITC